MAVRFNVAWCAVAWFKHNGKTQRTKKTTAAGDAGDNGWGREAEVNALAMGEAMNAAVVSTLESMGVRCHSRLYGDNTAANQVAEARGTWRTRSLSTKVNALRTRVQRGLLDLQFVSTKEQRGDGLTKCGGVIHNKLMREQCGLVQL